MNRQMTKSLTEALWTLPPTRGLIIGKTADEHYAFSCAFSTVQEGNAETRADDTVLREGKEIHGYKRRFSRYLVLANHEVKSDVFKALKNDELFETVLRPLSFLEYRDTVFTRLTALLIFSGQSFVYRFHTIAQDKENNRALRSTYHYIPQPGRFHLLTEDMPLYAEPITLSFGGDLPENPQAFLSDAFSGKPLTYTTALTDLCAEIYVQ